MILNNVKRQYFVLNSYGSCLLRMFGMNQKSLFEQKTRGSSPQAYSKAKEVIDSYLLIVYYCCREFSRDCIWLERVISKKFSKLNPSLNPKFFKINPSLNARFFRFQSQSQVSGIWTRIPDS